MRELKRCPFCGDEVDIVPTGLYHWKYAIHHKSKTECILDANAFVLPYEEEDAARMWNTRAYHKTENSSEKPNNCEDLQDWKDRMWAEAIVTEPTISKMEQVEDEPKTQMKTQNSNLTFEKADERCKGCNHYKLTCDLFSEICHYEPKDEPQTERSE